MPYILKRAKMASTFLVFLFMISGLRAQNDTTNTPTHPIIFGETYFGIGSFKNYDNSLWVGANMNYQWKKNLLTFRLASGITPDIAIASLGFGGLPILDTKTILLETAFLYGKRWLYDGHSLSFSLGISHNTLTQKWRNENAFIREKEKFLGIPYEFNIKWFKKKKSPYHVLYELLPVGRPTAFGHSFGFKLAGNVSKASNLSVGFTYGIGIHKKYE